MKKYGGKFVTEAELIKDLRERGFPDNKELSDEYLVTESHQLGEWEEVEVKAGDAVKYFWEMFTSGTSCNPKMVESGEVVALKGDYVTVKYEGTDYSSGESLGIRQTDVHVSRITEIIKKAA